jgi:dTDP-4-amino-4,6-dideoxygalactose transaminase
LKSPVTETVDRKNAAMDAVPQCDPKAAYLEQRREIDDAVRRVLDGGWYILGPEVEAFEAEFAAYCGGAAAVGVSNGTDALTLALEAMGIVPGDVVATVSHTAVATVAAIEMAGAIPALVDVDGAYGMDPDGLAALLRDPAIGPRVRAVIPVHLYGQAVDMDAVCAAAADRGVPVLEDASQAHGARWRGRRVGSLAAAAAFSLYPTKNLGALGDAGILTANDPALAERARAKRQYGWRARYVSDEAGRNVRLDEVQAALLRVKLTALDEANRRRAAVAARYDAAFADLDLELPLRRPGAEHVFHQYVVQTPHRDALRAALTAAGVGCAVHYPQPVHRQPAYAGRLPVGPAGLSATDRLTDRILSLPMFPQLSEVQIERTIAAVRAFHRR